MTTTEFRLFLALLLTLLCLTAQADPLDTIPTIENHNLFLRVDLRSDLWSSPYAYKLHPLHIYNTKLAIPLANSEDFQASLNVNYESLNIGRSDVRLGKKLVFVGKDLEDQSTGLGARKFFSDGSSVSLFFDRDTASDEPFHQRNEWWGGTLIYRSRQIDHHRWITLVNQTENRGAYNGKVFAYAGVLYQPDTDFTAMFGFPFVKITWGSITNNDWIKDFSLTPFGAHLAVQKGLSDDFVFGAITGISSRSYLHDARVDTAERLFYQETFLETSLKKILSPTTALSFCLGTTFDRRLYESETIYVPNSPVAKLQNDIYGRAVLEFRLW